jgi:peroxiredoxin 2/4
MEAQVRRSLPRLNESASDFEAIDDEGVLRAMIYYPLTDGRSVDEVMRIVQALQVNKSKNVATPEGWRPGQKVILPPPVTAPDAEGRANDKIVEVTDGR